MNKNLWFAGALAGALALAAVGPAGPADAGWGPPFACGAGQKTQTINWDQGIATPGEVKAAITGEVAATPAPTEPEWTVEDLKAAKPTLVYYYVEGLDATNGIKDPSFKFAQSFEIGGLGERVVGELNDNWRCKKVGLDLDADRKEEKNQARIELWSYTGVKLGVVGLKSDLSQSGLMKALKNARVRNVTACNREIKRLETLEKAREKAEKDAADEDTGEVAAK